MTYRTVTAPEIVRPATVEAPDILEDDAIEDEDDEVGEDDILELAAEIIETEGWTQQFEFDGNGYCALGAIREATKRIGPSDYYHCQRVNEDAILKLARRLPGNYPFAPARVSRWNDRYAFFWERRKRRIVATIRAAARS